MSTTNATIERRTPPPLRPPGPVEFTESHTIAVVTAGEITADLLRLAFWDPADRDEHVHVAYEVRVNGLPDNFGLAQVLADDAATLTDLAAVCTAAAALLSELDQ